MSEGLASLFESILFVIFLSVFLEPKCRGKRFYFGAVLTAVLLFVNISVSDYISIFNGYTILIDLLITFVFWKICLSGTLLRYLVAFALYYMGLCGCAYLSVFVFSLIDQDLIGTMITTDNAYRIWLILFDKILLIIYVIILLYYKRKFRFCNRRIIILCYVILPMVAFIVFAILTSTLVELYFMQPEIGIRIVSTMLGVLFILGVAFGLAVYVSRKQDEEQKIETLNYMLEMQKESLEHFIDKENETYKLKHELERKLFAVQYLFQQDREEEGIQILQQLITDLCGNAKEITISRNIVDTVIANTERKYESDRFILEKEISIYDVDIMELVDLCILLGNLADNAIEAAIESVDGQVKIKVMEEYGCIHIRVSNTYSGEKSDVVRFISRKSDAGKHGFGMQSIREIVRRYGGEFVTSYKDGWFYADVVIYGQDSMKYQK